MMRLTPEELKALRRLFRRVHGVSDFAWVGAQIQAIYATAKAREEE